MSGNRRWLGAGLVLAFLLAFGGPGVWADFTPDDLMNIHGAWNEPLSHWTTAALKYWSPAYRPAGSLFLGGFYRAFGFNPLPFRLFLGLLLIVNAVLVWRVARSLGASEEGAWLAAALSGVHVNYQPLYYNTGYCYDILCFTFFYSALAGYVHLRRAGGLLRWYQWLVLVVLYICALDSKELAVTLPLLLLAYETVYQRPWNWRALAGCLVLGLLTVPFVVGKTSGEAVFFKDPAYTAELTPMAYFRGWTGYLNELFLRHHFDVPRVFLFLTVSLALCWRSRLRLYGWLILVVGIIPMALVPPRGLAAVYVPMAGLAVLVGSGLMELRQRLVPRVDALAVLVLVLAGFGGYYAGHHIFDAEWILSEQRVIRHVYGEMKPLVGGIPHGARVITLKDPFAECAWGRWSSEFLLRLLLDDHDAGVQRLDQMAAPPSEEQMKQYGAVFDTRDGRLVRLR